VNSSEIADKQVEFDAVTHYYRISQLAIEGGLLTEKERDIISRKGTRKAGYWSRHLRDLIDIVRDRMDDRMILQINQELEEAERGLQLSEYATRIDGLRTQLGQARDQLSIAKSALYLIRDLMGTFLPDTDEDAWRQHKIVEAERIASTALQKISDVGKEKP
jgi:hypothetical protein